MDTTVCTQTQSKDYLSRENTKCLKGILAVCVLAHHLYQHSGLLRNGWLRYLGAGFQALGFVVVACFFFLSGYGLILSFRKDPLKIRSFGRHKIIPFYLIILLLVIIYYVFYLCLGQRISAVSIVKSLTFGGTIIANGWYLQVQLLYYLMFYLVFRFVRKKQLLLMLAMHIVYIVLCIVLGLSSLLYERTLIFVYGMIWYEKRETIDNWINSKKSRWAIIWLASCVLFAFNYMLSFRAVPVLFRGLSYFFFVTLVIMLLTKIKIQNRVTSFLGAISLEIYVVQGLFLILFHIGNTNVSNPYLYILAVTSSTIISALILHPLIRLVYSSFKKL
ncbi:MAG: acyltransferase [Clostridia bacterium]|nr:acyltransferase [Clostridia bacterium]